jgi:hypothetical protein
MEDDLLYLISLKKNNKLKSEIIKTKFEGLYKNQLTEYSKLQNKVNYIKDLLSYKNNLTAPDYSKFDKLFYLKKRINSSIYNNTMSHKKISSKKNKEKDINTLISLNNSVLKKIFSNQINNKRLLTSSNLLIERKRHKNNYTANNTLNSNTTESMTCTPSKSSKNNLLYIPTILINRHENKNFFRKNNSNKLSLYLDITNKKSKFSDYLESKNNKTLSNLWYTKYKYKNENINFIKNKKKIIYNVNNINIKDEGDEENDYINEEINDKYQKYFLRGLSLSREQNHYYQKCKKIDYLFYDDENNKKDKKKNSKTISNTKYKQKNIKSNKINYQNFFSKENKDKTTLNHNNKKLILKYSLKNLLNTENPIKIKI